VPIYEYHCNDCDSDFEYLVIAKSEPSVCPSCGKGDVNKLISACSFLSKGGNGETVTSSASGSSCGGCSATSCSGCGG